MHISVSSDLLEIKRAGPVRAAASPQSIPLSSMDRAGISPMPLFSSGKRGESQRAPHLHASRGCLLKNPSKAMQRKDGLLEMGKLLVFLSVEGKIESNCS